MPWISAYPCGSFSQEHHDIDIFYVVFSDPTFFLIVLASGITDTQLLARHSNPRQNLYKCTSVQAYKWNGHFFFFLLLIKILTQGNEFELGVEDGFERIYPTAAWLPCLVGQASAAPAQRGKRNEGRGAGEGGNGKREYWVICFTNNYEKIRRCKNTTWITKNFLENRKILLKTTLTFNVQWKNR